MKIKLSEEQWKQVIAALDTERVIGKITKSLKHGSVVAPRGWLGATIAFEMDFFDTDIDLSTDDVESLETKRDEIDDEVVAIDANDADEPINDIKEHLSDALEKANEVESLEAIRKKIEAQQDEQKENGKDKKIAELTAKVDTQQMAIRGKDGEIASLKSERNSLVSENLRLSDHLHSAECYIKRLRDEIDYRCRFDRPRPLPRGMF